MNKGANTAAAFASIEDEVKAYVTNARIPKPDYPDIEDQYKGHDAVIPYRDEIEAMVDIDLRDEISDGIQTIQYQLITLMTTNGQAPFVSMYIDIEELADDESAQKDMAMVIKEVLLQRIVGVPNEDGVFLPTAFPKILYVLDENNKPGEKFAETDDKPKSKFWDLTYLAAICSANVMTPDYISAKQMRAMKDGDVYACMGCVDGESVIDYKDSNGNRHVESFESAWNRLSLIYDVKIQPNGKDEYIDTDGIEIFDNVAGRYVKQYRIIRNTQSEWYRITFTGGRSIDVTDNHPFEINGKGIVFARDLVEGDSTYYLVTDTSENCNDTVILNEICSVTNTEYHHDTKYSYDVTTETEHFMVNGIYSHNCRSFLTVDRFSETYGNIANAKNYKPGTRKYWGRFNQGVSTISLPHVALSSGGNMDKFWEILDERTEINHRFLRKRHERLLGTPSDVAPLLWQHGVYARLKPGEPIDKLLYHGYSTISLGYAGLYECVKYMTGESHMDGGIGEEFGLKVLQFLNDKCTQWREAEDIDYSLYGTPMESTTYKFAKALQRDFGIIPGITDKNYVTNSYHQHVTEKTDGFTKLAREALFQKLSPGGAISYIEMPDMQGNIPAVMAYIQFIYDTIMYAEFNIKKDYCETCGFEGTIDILHDNENKKFYWKCPCCGNTDRSKMHIFRRMCGYPGENECNQGRYAEFADRVLHVDQREMVINMTAKMNEIAEHGVNA